jgi:hypothetical protein
MKYITYEQAKWLDKIGYKNGSTICYDIQGNPTVPYYGTKFYNGENNGDGVYEAPEQHHVVDWLLEKHNIWINVSIDIKRNFYYQCNNLALGLNINNYPENMSKPNERFQSPQEAYSASFDYIKDNNLI